MGKILLTILAFIFLLFLSINAVMSFNIFYKLNLVNYNNNKREVQNVIDYLSKNHELETSPFNEKEIMHLKDVYNLFLLSRVILVIALILSVIFLRDLFLPAICSLIFSIALAIILYLSSFKFLFIKFHEFLFFNNYWILDPTKDLLIRLFPAVFFQSSFYTILMLFIALNIIFIIVLFLLRKVL